MFTLPPLIAPLARAATRPKHSILAACAAMCLALVAMPAGAQCSGWRAVAGNTDAEIVFSSTTWDPDGAGPALPRLVVGGRFAVAGWQAGSSVPSVSASSIAAYDGTSWSALGAGVTGSPQYALVHSLASYNNSLYAGGSFTTAGGQAITGVARWNGSAWSALGGGVWSPDTGTGVPAVFINALTVYNGELIVAGGFQRVNGPLGTVVNNIARWNGTTWQGMAGGSNTAIYALAVHEGDLYAAGAFTSIGGVSANRIARWNAATSTWHPVGNGIDLNDYTASQTSPQDSIVFALASYAGSLFAGGKFSAASGAPAHDIARWDSASWTALGEGVTRPDPDFFAATRRGVFALTVFGGQLIAGGEFRRAGAGPALNMGAWNGTSWTPLGDGLGTDPAFYADEGVYTLTTFNSRLVAGGVFSNSNLRRYAGLAQWDGSSWIDTAGVLRGYTSGVRALAPWEGGVIVGGNFGYVYGPGALPWNLLRWNGLGFADTGLYPYNSPDFGVIHAAFSAPAASPPNTNNLYLGGDFTSFAAWGNPGVSNLNRIVRLNSLAAGYQPMGNGFNNTVRSITSFNGSIYGAGDFTASGAALLNHIARWNGTAWQGVVSAPTPGPDGVNGPVLAMRGYTVNVNNVRLVVGGGFTTAGGVAVSNVAGFTQGTTTAAASWGPMGAGFNNVVRALEFFNGSIYAGGDFTASGATSLGHIARWNGTAWVDVGGGVSAAGSVYTLKVSNGTLVVGGAFAAAGGLPATTNLARWNGTAWSPIDAGTNGPVLSLASFAGELHVGGEFTAVGSPAKYAMGYARFLETGVPWIARGVQLSGSQCPGRGFLVSAAVAEGYENLSPQWRRDGVALMDGFTPWGSYIAGANTFTLEVLNTSASDSGSYDLSVTSPCGNTTSGAYTVSIPVCDCIDFNDDGLFPDITDIADFLTVFSGGPCSNDPNCGDIDFNNDGLFPDTTDIQSLLSVFGGGACL